MNGLFNCYSHTFIWYYKHREEKKGRIYFEIIFIQELRVYFTNLPQKERKTERAKKKMFFPKSFHSCILCFVYNLETYFFTVNFATTVTPTDISVSSDDVQCVCWTGLACAEGWSTETSQKQNSVTSDIQQLCVLFHSVTKISAQSTFTIKMNSRKFILKKFSFSLFVKKKEEKYVSFSYWW